MTTEFSTANLKDIISFPFRDEKWLSKLLIATLLAFFSFLIFPIFLLAGYIYEIMRRVIVEREAPSLPEWDDWGEYLTNGFKMWGVGLIYSIPSLLMMLPYFGMVIFVPFLVEDSNSGALAGVLMMFFFGLMAIGFILSIVSWILLIPAWGHMVAKGEFKAAFQIKEFWPVLRNNLVGYLLSLIIYIGLTYVVAFVSQILVLTVILCLLYPLILALSTTYLYMVMSALFAQSYVEGVENTAVREADLLEPAAE